MEIHHLQYNENSKKAIKINKKEIELQKAELKLLLNNWRNKKKVEVFIDAVQKKNQILNDKL
ncbi:MAG: hypothetical protein ACFFBP_11340 [Promethearchaeota archaeon]